MKVPMFLKPMVENSVRGKPTRAPISRL